eukprot:TRINITY_DN2300_c5_g3_i2.p1 TRINITY_DN2300_c5_g3~~TRINITY_DN2300_c5_g3_i2.p1  ORF type:complete len:256 (-),score=60.29 TRINITY_DN2300_c5_g3_i2:58-825(-)
MPTLIVQSRNDKTMFSFCTMATIAGQVEFELFIPKRSGVENIFGKKFTGNVIPSEPDAHKSLLETTEIWKEGETNQGKVTLFDRFGNRCTTGDQRVVVFLSGSHAFNGVAEHRGQGVFVWEVDIPIKMATGNHSIYFIIDTRNNESGNCYIKMEASEQESSAFCDNYITPGHNGGNVSLCQSCYHSHGKKCLRCQGIMSPFSNNVAGLCHGCGMKQGHMPTCRRCGKKAMGNAQTARICDTCKHTIARKCSGWKR